MVPLVFQSIWISVVSSRTIDRLYENSVSRQIESLETVLNLYMNQLEDFSRSMSADDELSRLLKDQNRTNGEMVVAINVLSEKYHLRIPLNVHILAAEGKVYSNFPLNNREENRLMETVKNFPWMESNLQIDHMVFYQDFALDYHEPPTEGKQLYVSKNIVSDGRYLGLLVLQMNHSLIERLLLRAKATKETTVFLMNDKGRLLVASDLNETQLSQASINSQALIRDKKATNGAQRVRWKGENYEFFYQVLPELSWTFVELTPSHVLYSDTNIIKRITVITLFYSLLIATVFFFLLTRKITVPLQRFSMLVRHMQTGHLTRRIKYKGLYEVEVLATGINAMLDRIQTQIETIREEENNRRKLEVDRLQAQISPHFVQNSLISLRWLAEEQNDRPLVEALISLTQILEYSFRQPDIILGPLQDELNYIRHYVQFQEAIICKPIQLILQIEEACRHIPIPKMTLQPLVENAIFHGFKGWDKRESVLTITAERSERGLRLVISDNGRGMTADETDALRREIAQTVGKRIGLANVVQRLKLNMGLEFRFNLVSEADVGTAFEFDIPIQVGEEADL
ncbi:cache domain-containing sensor histidine kinase [Paenibacillus beijingensis]|nr:sensor histidine kinase [Paenibacillus beijingensis]